MKLHEKSLELNITHELLNLADSWHWFLTDIPLWRYWRPRYRLPFFKLPKSTAAGFHITTEGKDDPTGDSGGGFDVRIRAGYGKHLLFIQFKKGDFSHVSPDPQSEFSKAPHEHFTFEVNGTKTNQHFVLRRLANGIGGKRGNAVVYAFPLIKDMVDLEKNSGKLIRKTKFVSVADLDLEATKAQVAFSKNKQHNFRIGLTDMNRCEVNFFFFFFHGVDRTPEIIADVIAVRFQKTLAYFLKEIDQNYRRFDLYEEYIPFGLRQAFIQYVRYLLHYFEVTPDRIKGNFFDELNSLFLRDEYENYSNSERDISILDAVFEALKPFYYFISSLDNDHAKIRQAEVPEYSPKFLIPSDFDNGINIKFEDEDPSDAIENLSYISI